jgi:hypothetical protein
MTFLADVFIVCVSSFESHHNCDGVPGAEIMILFERWENLGSEKLNSQW